MLPILYNFFSVVPFQLVGENGAYVLVFTDNINKGLPWTVFLHPKINNHLLGLSSPHVQI